MSNNQNMRVQAVYEIVHRLKSQGAYTIRQAEEMLVKFVDARQKHKSILLASEGDERKLMWYIRRKGIDAGRLHDSLVKKYGP